MSGTYLFMQFCMLHIHEGWDVVFRIFHFQEAKTVPFKRYCTRNEGKRVDCVYICIISVHVSVLIWDALKISGS